MTHKGSLSKGWVSLNSRAKWSINLYILYIYKMMERNPSNHFLLQLSPPPTLPSPSLHLDLLSSLYLSPPPPPSSSRRRVK
ncbi:hypothetical protein Sjap_001732 [Stephania japonica]|uniref:Uncharacterized protein n=1 Tax=Stephania japonica TaxID=461633 RepID=A0AAP0PRZ3_9MAGN